MAVSAKFVADMTTFQAAVEKSVVQLRDWQKDIGNVDKSLTKMSTSFSGSKVLQEATLAAKAVEAIGGATALTAKEQASVNALVTEAIAKYNALGQQAPADIQKLQQETAKLEPPLTMAQKAAGLLSSAFGQFTAANLVSNAISSITSKVGEFIATGTKLPAVEASFQKLTSGIHQNSGEMLRAMDSAAQGLVSDFDLMLSANKAMLLGLPVTSQSMGELTKAATTLGRAMGKDATSSVDDLITALGRSSPQILDNLGLTVKVGDANEAYAAKLGKTSEQLTESEKKMAFYAAAMEAARAKTAELGDQTKTLGEIADTAWTKFGNVVSHAAADINVGLGASLSSLKGFAALLGDIANVGPGLAIQMARTRAEAEAMAKSGHDVNLALEPTVDVLGKYRDHLAGLGTAIATVTPEQQKLINQAADLGESAGDIAKALGIETVAVQATIDAHKKAAEAAQKHAEELKAFPPRLQALEAQFSAATDSVAMFYAVVAQDTALQDAKKHVAEFVLPFQDLQAEIPKTMQYMGMYMARWNELSVSVGASAQDMAKQTTSAFGSLTNGMLGSLDNLWKGMSGGNGFSGLMNNLGDSIVNGFGNILSGGLTSVINMGVNLAVEGVAKIGKLIGGLFQSEESKKVNNPRDQFFGQFGNDKDSQYQNLAASLTEAAGSGDIANQLISSLYDADTAGKFKSAEQAIADVFAASGKQVKTFRQGTLGQYPDFGSGTLAMLHGKERVVPYGEGQAESAGLKSELAALREDMRRRDRDLPNAIALAVQAAVAMAPRTA